MHVRPSPASVVHRSADMDEIVCSIEIDAPPKAVWGALVDLGKYHEWNPFIREATGEMKVGGRVRVRVRSMLPVPLVLHATVVALEPERELLWRGHVLAPWLGAGEHAFTLEPLGPDRTRFTQREMFTGALPRLLRRLLARETRRGFDAMNRALETRAEGARPAPVRAPSAFV
jgi:hypothetical protein